MQIKKARRLTQSSRHCQVVVLTEAFHVPERTTRFDRSEELRAELLEMPKWSIVKQPQMKRRKTNTTASALPKAQFPGPQQPHPPQAINIIEEVKQMIATADTLEEVDGAAIVAGQICMHEGGPSNMPPMPPPEQAAMDVDSDKQQGSLLTKKEEWDIVDFQKQQPGTPTPGVEMVHSQSSVHHHFESDPHPTLLIEERVIHPYTGKPTNQWECISCELRYEQCCNDHCVQGKFTGCACCEEQLRARASYICNTCQITPGMIPTIVPQDENLNNLSIYHDPYEAAIDPKTRPVLQC